MTNLWSGSQEKNEMMQLNQLESLTTNVKLTARQVPKGS